MWKPPWMGRFYTKTSKIDRCKILPNLHNSFLYPTNHSHVVRTKNRLRPQFSANQSTRTWSSLLRNSSFHDSQGPIPDDQDEEKVPLDNTSCVIKRSIPRFLTASSKISTTLGGIAVISAETASASPLPTPKARAIPVACDHSCKQVSQY